MGNKNKCHKDLTVKKASGAKFSDSSRHGMALVQPHFIPAEILEELRQEQAGYNIGIISFSKYVESATSHFIKLDNYTLVPYVKFFTKDKMDMHAAAQEDLAYLEGRKRFKSEKLQAVILTPEEEFRRQALLHIITLDKKGEVTHMPRLDSLPMNNFIINALQLGSGLVKSCCSKTMEVQLAKVEDKKSRKNKNTL